jgi:hypothetical protein
MANLRMSCLGKADVSDCSSPNLGFLFHPRVIAVEVFKMELLIPPRHREQFSVLRNNLTTNQAKVGPVTWNGYLRIETTNQELIDVLKQELDAQPQ